MRYKAEEASSALGVGEEQRGRKREGTEREGDGGKEGKGERGGVGGRERERGAGEAQEARLDDDEGRPRRSPLPFENDIRNPNNHRTLPRTKERIIYYVKSSSSSSSSSSIAHQSAARSSRYGNRNTGRGSVDTGDGAATSSWYEVRTQAWSCTCKAWAFGAYGAGGDRYVDYEDYDDVDYEDYDDVDYEAYKAYDEKMSLDNNQNPERGEEAGDGEALGNTHERGREKRWRWGGLTLEEHGGANVPVCKHLFACVLAEQWGVAGGLVGEREVGREEMGGWGGGWGG